jgi:MarR family transcriptional regulator, lower aerobic nicotinate degradation pathway regulator
MAEGPPGLQDWTGYLLIKTGWWVQRETEAALRRLGLRDRHLMALAILDADDSLSQQDLARHLALDPTLIVGLVDDLESQGLCTRTRHPSDRRRYTIQLTREGRELYQEARSVAAEVGDDLYAPLTRAERAQLTGLLKRVMAPLWDRPR